MIHVGVAGQNEECSISTEKSSVALVICRGLMVKTESLQRKPGKLRLVVLIATRRVVGEIR